MLLRSYGSANMLLESVKRKEKSLRWEGFVNRQVLSLQGKSERVVDVDGAWWINRRWCDRHRKWRSVFTARCYASAVLAMGLCPSVSVSVSVCVCLSVCHKPVFYWNGKTWDHTNNTTRYPRDSSFLTPKIAAKFDRGHPLRGHRMQVGGSKSATFDIYPAISRKR